MAPHLTWPLPRAPADVGGEAAPAGDLPSDALIILPTRNSVLFPQMVGPFAINRPVSIAAAQAAVREQRPIGLLMQRDPNAEEPGGADLHRIGCVANIVRYMTAQDGTHHIICQGVQRFQVTQVIRERPYLAARVLHLPEPSSDGAEIEARLLHLRTQALRALELLPQAPQELVAAVNSIDSAAHLADFAATYMDITAEQKQEVLESLDLRTRMDKVLTLLSERIEVLRLTQEISQKTRASLDQRQREAILREQLATIQRQLGDESGGQAEEARELLAKVDDAGMPDDVADQARKEIRRFERLPDGAIESGMVRSYLDWLVALPWKVPDDPPIDLAKAREILEAEHYGLEKIKRRILEYLAVRKLAPHGRAPILCFVGPPGVGKTSLGQSIAHAMGRAFVRVSLGGVHDEAEIRGHRRTYVGALPGNIIQSIRKAGARNCVMMLDELDKMGRGAHGDPSAAMLEVLDPEQNSTFRDNYLGVPFDLSRVVFIATANTMDTIPGPLQDRMEVISLAGYTEEEKLQISLRYLVPRQLAANGLRPEQAGLSETALRMIIRRYTREAGVRNLEREIGRALRHAAMLIAEGAAQRVDVDEANLADVLGPPRFENEMASRTSASGVATGLAWTPVGGDILFIEAARSPGRGGLTLTGQLGDVMRESAQAALTLVKSRAEDLGIEPSAFERSDIHVHVPAGAIPKDGPSAGVAMFTALASLFTGRKVRSDVAMTGEISLRGLVLPVGGIKEKVTAAARAGVKRVVLPARNRNDLEDIPAEARRAVEIHWAETVDDVLREAIEPEPGAS
jgi:ATP-dependent Lon protease